MRLLTLEYRKGRIATEKIEEGYHAVVLETDPNTSPDSFREPADYVVLKAFIPNLGRTRAVCLNAASGYELSGIETLRQWAGHLARNVESGNYRALAVVDPEVFAEGVAAEFRAAGWVVERSGHDLRVSDRRFVEQPNLLNGIVRMVLSRSSMQEAARVVRREIAEQFSLDADLFQRFERRFEKLAPEVLDHYFAAYPEASGLAVGWDYWQVLGKTPAEAQGVFDQAMEEFQTFLEIPSAGWQSRFAAGCCGRGRVEK